MRKTLLRYVAFYALLHVFWINAHSSDLILNPSGTISVFETCNDGLEKKYSSNFSKFLSVRHAGISSVWFPVDFSNKYNPGVNLKNTLSSESGFQFFSLSEICDNGIDDDGDGLIDEADPDCQLNCAGTGDMLSHVYFIPFPEEELHRFFRLFTESNNGSISNGINSTISIVVAEDSTVIRFDHWEDGFENSLLNPVQNTTQIWGDGNPANGKAPGYNSDIFHAGDAIQLDNVVTLPRNSSSLKFDGRDLIVSSRPLTATRVAWPQSPGPELSVAIQMTEQTGWGTVYEVPVGENTPASSGMFGNTGVFTMACQNGTTIQIDKNGDGSIDTTRILNKGQSFSLSGGIFAGAKIFADHPVQVTVCAGDLSSEYETRWFTLAPLAQWGNSYFMPVGTTVEFDPAHVFIYNPNPAAIHVNYNTARGSGSFNVSSGSTHRFEMPMQSGAKFYTTDGSHFYGIGTMDSDDSDNDSHEWGISLIPAAALGPEALVGWGAGSKNLSRNGSPVWVTPSAATTIYVDYDGNPATGPEVDIAGNHFDIKFQAQPFRSYRVLDPDTDQTGMRLYTLDGKSIAVAWGQDPSLSSPSNPFLDLGTSVASLQKPYAWNEFQLISDADNNGIAGPGDTILVSLFIKNATDKSICDITVKDTLPPNFTYVENTAKRNGVAIPGQVVPPAGTVFPLDETGFAYAGIAPGSCDTIRFKVRLDTVPAGMKEVNARFQANIGSSHSKLVAEIKIPVAAAATPHTVNFTDTNENPVSFFTENSTAQITITDAAMNRDSTSTESTTATVQNLSGTDWEDIIFTENGTNSDIFNSTIVVSSSAGDFPGDGILNASPGDTLSASYVAPGNDVVSTTAVVTTRVESQGLYFSDPALSMDRNNPIATQDTSTALAPALATSGALQVDNVTFSSIEGVNSFSFSHTTTSAANRLLLVGFSGDKNGEILNAVTYNGLPLTYLGSINNNDKARIEIWSLLNPPAGSYNIHAVFNTTSKGVMGAVGFSGVDMTNPIGNFSSVSGSGNSINLNMPAGNGEILFNVLAWKGAGAVTQGSGVTQMWNLTNGGGWTTGCAGILPVSGASANLSWTRSGSEFWSMGVVPVRPAPSGIASTSFTQTTSLCSALTMPAGGLITATAHVDVVAGIMPVNPNVTATLKYDATTFATLTTPVYDSLAGTLTWAGALPGVTTIPAGKSIVFNVATQQNNLSFRIKYDSDSAPSGINLPVTSIIKVDSVNVYNAPYPGGSKVTSCVNGDTVYVRSFISDPFGSNDITKADLDITFPDGTPFIDSTLSNVHVAGVTGCGKIYEFRWPTSNQQGLFNIKTTGYAGYDGVTASAKTRLDVGFLDNGTPSQANFTNAGNVPVTAFQPDSTICMSVRDFDQNLTDTLVESVSIKLESSSGDQETVILTETGVNTGIFKACMAASSTLAGTSGNGQLYAREGDILSFTYTDPDTEKDKSAATANVQSTAPVMRVIKSLKKPFDGVAIPGEQLEYEIAVSNPGPTILLTAILTDTFDLSCMSYVSSSYPLSGAGPGSLSWNVAPIMPGEIKKIKVFFNATGACNPGKNIASGNGMDENAVAVAAAPDTALVIVANPKMTVDKALVSPVSGPIFVGDTLTYNITVTNTGTSIISLIPLSDQYSDYFMKYVSASPAATGGGGVVLWDNLGPLAPGASTTVTVKFIAMHGTPVNTNHALVEFAVDTFGNKVPAVIDRDISHIESPPLAVNDAVTTPKNTAVTIPVASNDSDPDGNLNTASVSVADVSGPAHGTVTVDPVTHAIVYTPAMDFFGLDSFQYKICDLTNLCDTAWVIVDVTFVEEICNNGIDDDNDGLADCFDPECGQPAIDLVSTVQPDNCPTPNNGQIVVSASGSNLSYSIDGGATYQNSNTFTGLSAGSFNIQVVNSLTGCLTDYADNPAVLTEPDCIEICGNGIDDDGDGLTDCDDTDCQPKANWDSFIACPGTPLQEQVIFNDSNIQNSLFGIAALPSNGSVSINNNGVFQYSPYSSSCTNDMFVYQVCSQVSGCCDTAVVHLILNNSQPPVMYNVPADITIDCGEPLPAPAFVYGFNGCPGLYVSYNEESNQSGIGGCQSYEIVRTWTCTDNCGNTNSASQTITVQDISAPEVFRVYTLPNDKRLAAGVAQRVNEKWRYVKFPVSFGQKPLVFSQVVTTLETSAVNVRMRNITTEGFEMRLREEEISSGAHAHEKVSWMAIEPGALTDTTKLQGFLMTNFNSTAKTLNFSPAFSGTVPAFISAIQTTKDLEPVAIRYSNLTTSSVSVVLEEEKSKDAEVTHANEDIAYLAFKPGTLRDKDNRFVGTSGVLNLTNDWTTVSLPRAFNKPVVIFGGVPTGGDPSLIRVRNVNAQSFEVRIQEWDYLDGIHSTTPVAYFVVEGSVSAVPEYYCDASSNNVTPGQNLFAVDNCDNQLNFNYQEQFQSTASGLKVERVWTVADDCGNTSFVARLDSCIVAAVKLKACIYGAMMGGGNSALMRDNLREKGFLPLQEPYSNLPGYQHKGGGGGETTTQAILSVTGPDAIVDWVFMEARDPDDNENVLATCSALLQRDGDIISATGDSVVFFKGLGEGDYNLAIRHRNHLGLLSVNAEYLSSQSVSDMNFANTVTPVNGSISAGQSTPGGGRALWPGDFNGDRKIIFQGPNNDIFYLFTQVMSNPNNTNFLANFIVQGYLNYDINMDGMGIYQGPNNDRSLLLYNTILGHPDNTANLANFIVSEILP